MSSLKHVTSNLRLVSALTLLSRVLGLVRDAAMAARFGNGPLLDAFTVAFRVPNLARALLGEGALATAFLPIYLHERETSGSVAANRFAAATLVFLATVLLGMILIGEFGLAALPLLFELSLEAEFLRQLSMTMLPYVGLVCMTSQAAAILQAEGRFGIPALMPAVLNLVWLLGLILVVPLWPDPREQMFATAGCVLAGGTVQLIGPLMGVRALGVRLRTNPSPARAAVIRLFQHMIPVVGGLMITQINVLADSVIAWTFSAPVSGSAHMEWLGNWTYPLTSGTASALYLGQRLYQFPLGVFGVALGTVLFPLLAEHAQRQDYQRLREDFILGLRYVAAIGIPASIGLMLIAHPLASICFEYGKFSAEDAHQTGLMIAAYGSGVWAYCGLLIVHRGFYALGDRITPLRVGVGAVMLNLVLSLSSIWWIGGVGLAIATSVVAMWQCVTTGWLLRRAIGGWNHGPLVRAVLLGVGCSLVMALCGAVLGWLVAETSGWSGRAIRLGLPLTGASLAYFGMAWGLGFREPWDVLLRRTPSSAAIEIRVSPPAA